MNPFRTEFTGKTCVKFLCLNVVRFGLHLCM
jgi:hypothetical protein